MNIVLFKKRKYAYCFLMLILSVVQVKGQNDMHITEQLLNGSIKIVAINGNKASSGTGFFFDFYNDNKKNSVPLIITNKHVVNGSKFINLYLKKAKNGKPDLAPAYIAKIPNNSSTVIQHPNKDIDLVAIPIAFIMNELYKQKINIFKIALTEKQIISDSIQKKELKAIEDVWMIGYPNGLWDSQNNLPIVRKGITATTPYIDYNGKREFLIDMAAFGGSSGSPIYYYRDMYTDKETYKAMVGVRLYLLGILYAGPLYTVEGKVIKTNPNTPTSKVKTGIPMNLGYVIKASEILEFKKILFPEL